MVIAHRGVWSVAPQNSLESVKEALALGCDGIEIDVRRTADGRLVVVHNARVGLRPVGRLAHEEIRARVKEGQAPLLREVLTLAAGRTLVDIELKEGGYVAEALHVVTEVLKPHQFVITSFLPAVIAEARAILPQARCGLLVGPRHRRNLEQRWRAAGADFLAPHSSLARAGVLDWAAQRGLPAWVWTVNEPRALRGLIADPRVEAVITDVPDRAQGMLTSR